MIIFTFELQHCLLMTRHCGQPLMFC